MILLDFFAMTISIGFLIKSIVMVRKEFNTRIFYYWFFWLVFVVPIYMDYLIGAPNYSYYGSKMGGFNDSYNDELTRMFYSVFLVFIQYMILLFTPKFRFKRRKNDSTNKAYLAKFSLNTNMFLICLGSTLLAPVFAIASGQWKILFDFSWKRNALYAAFLSRGVTSYIEQFSYIGVLGGIILLHFWKANKLSSRIFHTIVSIALIYINSSIESKRSIIYFVLIVYLYIYFLKGSGKNFLKAFSVGFVVICIVIGVNLYVKVISRGYIGYEALYTSFRIDFFRDDTVKLAIYSFLHSGEYRILSYPFQSYIEQIRFFFLLSLLSGKGYIPLKGLGYDYYLTAALSNTSVEYSGKWMTTSLFDESIANFSFFGIIIVGIILPHFLRYIDEQSEFEKVFLFASLILYTMYSLDYILIFIEFMIIIRLFLKSRIFLSFRNGFSEMR